MKKVFSKTSQNSQVNTRNSHRGEGDGGAVLCQKGVFTNFSKFIEKHLCRCLFLIKLQA